MATISEIPIDVTEAAQPDEQVDAETVTEMREPPSMVVEEEAPKKRGRPPGSRNRPKVVPLAPKPQKKPVAKKAPPVEYESESEEEEETPQPPPVLKRKKSRAPPSEYEEEEQTPDIHNLAHELLNVLSQRKTNQNELRRRKYATWFQNRNVY